MLQAFGLVEQEETEMTVNFTYAPNDTVRLRRGIHGNGHLQAAWSKYGEENFGFVIVTKVEPRDCLLSAEQAWLDCYLPEYNILKRAGSGIGYEHTKEAKKKISQASKGKKLTPEHCAKISAAKKGAKLTESHKENLRQFKLKNPVRYWKGKKRSRDTCQKISKAQAGRKSTPKAKRNQSIAITAWWSNRIGNDRKWSKNQ